jgi:membrane protein implicated in regulation of membrane protease activity
MTFSADILPWVWAVAAVVIAMMELAAPGTYLIWIACAAAITSAATFVTGWSLSAQLTTFIVSSLGTCVAGYYVYRRLKGSPKEPEAVNQRDLDLVGTTGLAVEAFTNGQGKARIGDTVWLAESADEIPAGAPVTVTSVRGTTVVVRQKSSRR